LNVLKVRNIPAGADAAPSTRGEDRAETVLPAGQTPLTAKARKNALYLSVQRAPLKMATLASISAACSLAFLAGGYSLYDTIIDAVLHRNAMAVLAVLAATMFSIYAAEVVASIAARVRQEERDKVVDARLEEVMRLSAAAMEEMHGAHARLTAAMAAHEEHTQVISDELDELRRGFERQRDQQAPRWKMLPNTLELWSNFAPGSTSYNMGGQGRLDLHFERREDGSLVCRPNWDRILQTWYLRFKTQTAVGRANIVIFMGDRKNSDIPDQLATHIVIFRCIKLLAERLCTTVELSRARFYLVYGRKPAESTFAGEQLLPNGERRRFGYRYSDQVERYAVPGVLQDDRVLVTNEAAEIDPLIHLIETVMVNQPSYSFDELERRFGHRVSGPKLPEQGLFGSTDGKPATFARRRTGDEIANGDHMSI
jgi:hypothetical protein